MKKNIYDNKLDMTSSEAREMVEKWINFDDEVADLVLMVIQGARERLASIKESFEANDINVLKEHTHAFKGVSGNFNIIEIYEVLLELDEYLKTNARIDRNVELLIQKLSYIVKCIPDEYYSMTALPPKLNDDIELEMSVLIASNTKEIIELIVELSYEKDINIDQARNKVDILEKLYKDDYDLLILEDKIDSIEVCDFVKQIREKYKQDKLKIILISNNTKPKDYNDLDLNYISRGIDKAYLLDKINTIINEL